LVIWLAFENFFVSTLTADVVCSVFPAKRKATPLPDDFFFNCHQLNKIPMFHYQFCWITVKNSPIFELNESLLHKILPQPENWTIHFSPLNEKVKKKNFSWITTVSNTYTNEST
jgi:hypothetical protein